MWHYSRLRNLWFNSCSAHGIFRYHVESKYAEKDDREVCVVYGC